MGWLLVTVWHAAVGTQGGRNSEGGRCLKFAFPRTLGWKKEDVRRMKDEGIEIVCYF